MYFLKKKKLLFPIYFLIFLFSEQYKMGLMKSAAFLDVDSIISIDKHKPVEKCSMSISMA